jgi:hypothetical protein
VTSLVVGPHPEDLDDPFLIEDLVDEAVLNADSAGVRLGEIGDELLERRRRLAWISSKDVDQLSCSGSEARLLYSARILLRLLREDDGSVHHPGLPEHSLVGVSIPSRMDSRIPGTESKNSVS